MADCLFATTGGAIQCATHEVDKWDYDDPEEFDAALVPLCIRVDCLNCQICNKGEPCRSRNIKDGAA